MKKITLLFLFLIPAVMFSQVSLFQTTDNTIAAGSTINCSSSSGSGENNYARLYDLRALGYASFTVNQISFGVESFTLGTATSYPVTVAVYSSTSGTTPTDLNLIERQDVVVTQANNRQIVNVNLTNPAMVNTVGMVIVIYSPSGLATGSSFFIGSNSNGQTAPGYLLAPDCSINSLSTYASIGYPDVHLVLYPTGTFVLGTESFTLEKETNVSPNPAINQLTISVPNGSDFKGATLFSVLGKEVLQSSSKSFDVSSLQAGVYFVNITVGDKTIVKKIIKN